MSSGVNFMRYALQKNKIALKIHSYFMITLVKDHKCRIFITLLWYNMNLKADNSP